MAFYLDVVFPDGWEANWHRQIQERIYIILKILNNSLDGIVLGQKKADFDDVILNNPNYSSEYATCASGTVTGVIGKDLRPGNIWENRELPALKNNPNIKK